MAYSIWPEGTELAHRHEPLKQRPEPSVSGSINLSVMRFAVTLCIGILISSGYSPAARAVQSEGQSDEIAAKSIFVQGMTQAYIGNHERAISFFEAALKIVPQNPDILTQLAKSYEALDELSTAIFFATSAVQQEPSISNKIFLMRLHGESGNHAQTAAIFRALADDENREPTQLLQMLPILLKTGLQDDAALLISSVSQHDPNNGHLAAIARTTIDEIGDPTIVLAALEISLESQPANTGIIILLSDLYMEHDRSADAIELLQKGISNPSIEDASRQQLAMLVKAFRTASGISPDDESEGSPMVSSEPDFLDMIDRLLTSEATVDLLKAEPSLIELNKRNPTARSQTYLGDLYFVTGRYAQAAEVYLAILESDVRNVQVWRRAAKASLSAGNINVAINAVEDGLLFFPGDIELVVVLALASFNGTVSTMTPNTFEDALARLGKSDRDHTVLFHVALSNIALANQDYQSARETLRDAQLMDRDSPYVNVVFGLLNAVEGNFSRALEQIHLAGDTAMPSAEVFFTAARVAYLAGQHRDALEYVNEATNIRTTTDDLELRGDIHFALDQFDEARISWTSALERDPSRFRLVDKLERLVQ